MKTKVRQVPDKYDHRWYAKNFKETIGPFKTKKELISFVEKGNSGLHIYEYKILKVDSLAEVETEK